VNIPPKVFEFGPWMPDKADMTVSEGVLRALNVIPAASGYAPWKTFNSVSSALTAYPRGAVQTRDDTDAVFQYAGDASKLYRNVSDTWTDSSKVGGYSTATGERWEFGRWKGTVIATNYADNPQTIDLGGSTFADLTTALKFKHIAVVRDFVFAGYTNDATDGEVPWRVRWPAIGDPTDWTVSAATQADYRDLTQRKIQRIFGGEYGVIMQDESITRAQYVGTPTIFQLDETVPGLGLLAPGAAVRANDIIFFLSSKGFFQLTSGSRADPIGLNQVDDTVLADIDATYSYRITAVADPRGHRIFWGYPGQGSISGQPNKIVCYDFGRQKWSEIAQVHELLWEASSSAVTLEGLDSLYSSIDDMDISLDSPTWVGGQRGVSMFDENYKHGFFDGAAREALIETGEFMFSADVRSKVKGFRPFVEGDDVTLSARVGSRNDVSDVVSYTEPLSKRGGRIPCRVNARYNRFELTISGDWSKAVGVMVERKHLASGGRRG